MSAEAIFQTGQRIALHIKAELESGVAFKTRSFYGEAFSLALLARYDLLDQNLKEKIFNLIEQKDKNDPEYHWEFVNYALFDYRNRTRDTYFDKLLFPLRFKETSCMNWSLLRLASKAKAKLVKPEDILEIKKKLQNLQQDSGLILDDRGVRSFQYHAFSTCLLFELSKSCPDPFFDKAFKKAVEFIRHFILPNGETLHIGRGQHQSFGQGCLLALLAFAFTETKNTELLAEVELIHKYLLRFERSPGLFPLVMNQSSQDLPQKNNFMDDPAYAGWYPYNNHYDYLPFFAFYLHMASEFLTEATAIDWEEASRGLCTSYQDKDFLLVSLTRYMALIARPGGYWSNEQSLPLIFYKKEVRTPCLGGECFQKSLYREDSLSLPFHPKYEKSLRWKALSFWLGNTLFVLSPLGFLKRSFHFSENAISLSEYFISPFAGWRHMRAFFPQTTRIDGKTLRGSGFTFKSSELLQDADEGLSAKGKIKNFWSAKAADLVWEFDS